MTMTIRTGPFGAVRRPQRWWQGGHRVATAFYTALSLAFPPGERFFVQTLAGVADQLPPGLKGEVRDFVRQETNHARQHIAFNRTMSVIGHDTGELEARFTRQLDKLRSFPPLAHVAFTAALEHLTTLLARAILRHPQMLAGAPADIRRFWRWHAVEEIEHKAVAFDVYRHLTAELSPFRRWRFRTQAMRAATRVIIAYAASSETLLRAGSDTPPRMSAGLLWFLIVRPGIFRHCLLGWLGFFVPGFHPSRHDDAALLATTSLEPLEHGLEAH